ncbi:MAG: sulfatase-like hydrolase/transferase, partial [Planctomycetaceae bacterium]|nr:sulfatase-like hydrolase/transferase [Planctomycetaceae bacterium]
MDSTSRRGFRLVGRMMNFAFVMTIAAGGVFLLLEPPSNQVCVLFAEEVTFSQVQPESDATPSGARDKNFIGSLRDLIQGSEVFESSDSQQGLFQILDEADGLLADAKAKNQDALRNVNRQVRVGAASLAPHFILVQMERVGFSDWGCYGGTSTPTIDKLADDGVRFTNFYAGGSDPEKSLWCLTTSA